MSSGGRLPDWARVSGERRGHIDRVAHLMMCWAQEMNIDPRERGRWLRAAYLHDALRDADPSKLKESAGVDWSPALLHGPAAARLARTNGEHDAGVLSAVKYHSVGYRDWDNVGKMLFMADFLEPGRNFDVEDREALARRVPSFPDDVLVEVAKRRICCVVDSSWLITPESLEFWNDLVRRR